MKKLFYLFKVSFQKSFIELVRYRFNTISQIISFCMAFLMTFYIMRIFGLNMDVSPIRLGETLEGLVIGYFLWIVMVMAYADTANNIVNDANRGTLEQISMSNLGLHNVLIVRSLTNLVVNLLISFIILFIVMYITNCWLDIKTGQLLLLIFIGIFSILGIALMFGGLALVFKKVQSFLNMVQYLLIALVIAGPYSFKLSTSALLPFRLSIEGIYRIVLLGESIADFSVVDFGLMIGNSAAYFFIGVFVFKLCSKVARKNGLLGQY